MLLQSVTLWAQNPHRRGGGSTASATDGSGARTVLGIKNTTQLAPFAGGFDKTSSLPTGWRHGNGWMPAQSSETIWYANLGNASGVSGAGAFSAHGALGKNAEATLAGEGTVSSADLGLIMYAVALLSGAGALSADIQATIAAAATLAGEGDLEGTLGALQSIAAQASLSGSGAVQAALGALAGMSVTAAGVGGATGSTLSAKGSMASEIKVTGDLLSTANVADAVWNALAAQFNQSGTMGQKLNGAASAGDPWSTELPGAYASGTAGSLLSIVAKILRNKTVTDPATGVMTVYDDDGTTPLFTAQLHEDVGETQTYRGQGAEVRGKLE